MVELAAHMSEPDDGLALRVLVNPRQAQIFPLSTAGARGRDQYRCHRVRAAPLLGADPADRAAPTFTPLVRPCPLVMTLHDCTIEADVGFAGSWRRQAAMRTVTGLALRRVAAVTAPSRASLGDIRRHYPAAPNPTVIPNGVDVR